MTQLPISRQALALGAHGIMAGLVAAGIHEEGGNNLGPEVEEFQRVRGGERGESWCLDVQEFAFLKGLANALGRAYTPQTIETVLIALRPTLAAYMEITGSCGELMADGKQRGTWIDRDKITVLRQGWLALYAFTDHDIENRVPHHVGMCDADWSRSTQQPIASLEGNTGDGNQADGDGCYLKHRPFAEVVGVYATY